jgi:hypothetical protein
MLYMYKHAHNTSLLREDMSELCFLDAQFNHCILIKWGRQVSSKHCSYSKALCCITLISWTILTSVMSCNTIRNSSESAEAMSKHSFLWNGYNQTTMIIQFNPLFVCVLIQRPKLKIVKNAQAKEWNKACVTHTHTRARARAHAHTQNTKFGNL